MPDKSDGGSSGKRRRNRKQRGLTGKRIELRGARVLTSCSGGAPDAIVGVHDAELRSFIGCLGASGHAHIFAEVEYEDLENFETGASDLRTVMMHAPAYFVSWIPAKARAPVIKVIKLELVDSDYAPDDELPPPGVFIDSLLR